MYIIEMPRDAVVVEEPVPDETEPSEADEPPLVEPATPVEEPPPKEEAWKDVKPKRKGNDAAPQVDAPPPPPPLERLPKPKANGKATTVYAKAEDNTTTHISPHAPHV